jgi:hypothetical protein
MISSTSHSEPFEWCKALICGYCVCCAWCRSVNSVGGDRKGRVFVVVESARVGSKCRRVLRTVSGRIALLLEWSRQYLFVGATKERPAQRLTLVRISDPEFKPFPMDVTEAAGNSSIFKRDLKNSSKQDKMGLGGLRCCEGSRPDHRCNALSTDSRINVGWTLEGRVQRQFLRVHK